MRAHKYAAIPVSTPIRKQRVIDVELCRLKVPGQDIPVAATSEPDRITLFWWDSSTGSWSNWPRAHDPISRSGDTMPAVTSWNWSHRLGFTGSDREVFLVYKRSITPAGANAPVAAQLYLDRLAWNAQSSSLTPAAGPPTVIPVANLGYTRMGHYLWAGYHQPTSKLLILAQLVSTVPADEEEVIRNIHELALGRVHPPDIRFFDPRVTGLGIPLDELQAAWDDREAVSLIRPAEDTPQQVEVADLVLLTADLSQQGIDLGLAASWNAQKIDDGGWDLDALLESDKVVCVYRRDPYSLSINDPQRVDEQITSMNCGT